jgi:two-component system response regulator
MEETMAPDPVADILLVEDNPADAELAQRALKRRKIENSVHVARDGQEALDYLLGSEAELAGRLPRVVFLDLKLPKISGLEVLQRLKSSERTRALPVVILSSSREESDVREAYRLGANSYVVKPVDFDSFVEAVGSLGTYWLALNQSPD